MDTIFQRYRHICSQLECQPTPAYLSALRSQSSSCVIEQLSSEQSDLQLYALACTLPYSSIASLTLNRATAGVATWWSFFEAVRRTTSVTHLAVTNSTFDDSRGQDRTMMDVGNKIGQLQLQTLDLSGTLLSAVLFQVMARGPLMRFQHLERLVLSECSLSDDTIRVMCNSIGSALITSGQGMKLKDLCLARNRITQIGALALARLLSGEVTDRPLRLRTLDLDGNKINEFGGEALAGALQSGNALECLNISHNPIGDSCLMEMASVWRRSPGTLKELHVSGVGDCCTIQGSMAFLQGVAKSSSLKVLDIRSLDLSSMLVTHALGKLLSSHKELQVLCMDIGGMDELRELMPAILQNKGLTTLWLGLTLDRSLEGQVLELCSAVANTLEGNAQKFLTAGEDVKGLLTVFNHASNQALLVSPIPRASVLSEDVHASFSNGDVMEDIRSRHDKQMGALSSEGSSLMDTGSISGSLPSYVSEASFRQDSPISRRSSRSNWSSNNDTMDLPKFPTLSVRTQRAADLASPRSKAADMASPRSSLMSKSSSKTPKSQKSVSVQARSRTSSSGSSQSPNSPLTPIDPWAPFSCTPRTALSGTPRVGLTPRSTMSGMTPICKAPGSMFGRTPATPAGSMYNAGGFRSGCFTPKTPFSVFGLTNKPRVPRPNVPPPPMGGPIPPAAAFRKHDKDDDMLLNMSEMVMALQDTSILHGLPALKLSNYLKETLDRMTIIERPNISLPEFMQCYEACCMYKTNHFRRQRAVRYPIGAGTNKALRRVFRAYSTPHASSFMQAPHSPQQPIMNAEQFQQLCSDAGFLQPTGLLTGLTLDIIFAQCKMEDRTGLSWLDFLKACVMIGQDNETHFDAVESAIMGTPIAIALRPPSPPRMSLLEDGKWSPRSRTSRSPRSPASAKWSPRSGSGSSYRSPRSPASFKRSPMSTPHSARSTRSDRERRARSPATLAAIKDQLLTESETSSDNSLAEGEKLITCKFNQVLDGAVSNKDKVTESLSDSSNALPEDLSESTVTPPTAGSPVAAALLATSPRKSRKSRRDVDPAPRHVVPDAPAWSASGAGIRRAAATTAKLVHSNARPPMSRSPSPTMARTAFVPVRAPSPRLTTPLPPAAPQPPVARLPPRLAQVKATHAPRSSAPTIPRVAMLQPRSSNLSARSSPPAKAQGNASPKPWNSSSSVAASGPVSPSKSTRSTRSAFSMGNTPPRYSASAAPKSADPVRLAVSQSLDSGMPRLTAELLASAIGAPAARTPVKHAYLKRKENVSTVSAPAFCSLLTRSMVRSTIASRPAWNSSGKVVTNTCDGRWP